jgi:hypothetical protein
MRHCSSSRRDAIDDQQITLQIALHITPERHLATLSPSFTASKQIDHTQLVVHNNQHLLEDNLPKSHHGHALSIEWKREKYDIHGSF